MERLKWSPREVLMIYRSSDDISDCIEDIKQAFAGYIGEVEIEQVPVNPQYEDFRITF
jgi:hypothetical protein